MNITHLIVVILAMKERLFLKDHTGQHAAETPHVQTVIIHLYTQYSTRLITIHNLKRKQQYVTFENFY